PAGEEFVLTVGARGAVDEVGLGGQVGSADGDAGVEVGQVPGDGLVVGLELQDAGVAEQLDAVAAGLEDVEEGALGDAVDVGSGFDLDAVFAAELRGVGVVLGDAVPEGEVVQPALAAG